MNLKAEVRGLRSERKPRSEVRDYGFGAREESELGLPPPHKTRRGTLVSVFGMRLPFGTRILDFGFLRRSL